MATGSQLPAPSGPPAPASGTDTGEEEDNKEEITLFAPFGAQKPTRSVFQRSSEYESEFSDSKSDSKSREIEFQNSETQSIGNAKVLFRKLKAVVSGSSASSLSMSTSTPDPNGSKPPSMGVGGNYNHTPSASSLDNGARGSRVSPTPSVGNSVMARGGVDQVSVHTEPTVTQSVEQGLSEEPRISLTSYSDAHSHMIKKTAHPGGGVARPQSQAVNKTEMLKRFGNIADNTSVQVCKS